MDGLNIQDGSSPAGRHRVLFVCLGNICRSPAAQGVFQSIVDAEGAGELFSVDSAGTYSGHEGQLPDRRMREAAARRGYTLTHRARPVDMTDFLENDVIVAMDDSNYADLMHLAPSVESSRKVVRMAHYLKSHSISYVPDPYYRIIWGVTGSNWCWTCLKMPAGTFMRNSPGPSQNSP